MGSGSHALAQVLSGGQPGAVRPVSLHAAAGPPVLAPAPGNEPTHPRTPAPVAQPHFGSRGRLLSAAILFAVSRGVRHDLTGTGGGSPRQIAAQDETDPTRCLSSATECPATLDNEPGDFSSCPWFPTHPAFRPLWPSSHPPHPFCIPFPPSPPPPLRRRPESNLYSRTPPYGQFDQIQTCYNQILFLPPASRSASR